MRRLEPWTPVFNLVREWPKFLIKKGRGLHSALARTLQSSRQAAVAVGNRGNRQLSLAWDDNLVTPLRSLDRPENVGAPLSVLGFCTCCV